MDCVIIWKNTENGAVSFIRDTDNLDEIAVFGDRDEAIALAIVHPLLKAFPYQIVELDEL